MTQQNKSGKPLTKKEFDRVLTKVVTTPSPPKAPKESGSEEKRTSGSDRRGDST